jgi:DNA-binding beta-propeller fold protein YncE
MAMLMISADPHGISLVAGTGTKGFNGDGSRAVNALLATPFEAALDSRGNIYIADFDNNRIRKIDRQGIITTVVGTGRPGFSGDGGPALKADLHGPHCVAIDRADNLYICDHRNQRVRKVAVNGTIATVAGNGEAGFSGDGGAAVKASLNGPEGLAFDKRGSLFIADFDNHRVRKVSAAGTITTVAGSGIAGFAGDGSSALRASMKFTPAVAIDHSGNMYICDRDNNRVRKVDERGIISTFAGNGTAGSTGDGDAAFAAGLNRPVGVVTDRGGNVYIAEREGNRVRKVSAAGIITTIAGTGDSGFNRSRLTASDAVFNMPRRLTIGPAGDALYLADTGNHCIWRIQL